MVVSRVTSALRCAIGSMQPVLVGGEEEMELARERGADGEAGQLQSETRCFARVEPPWRKQRSPLAAFLSPGRLRAIWLQPHGRI